MVSMSDKDWPIKKAVVEQVTWLDPASRAGWGDLDEYETASYIVCVSVGILLKDTKDKLVLVQSMSRRNMKVAESITIPKGIIIHRVRLGTVKYEYANRAVNRRRRERRARKSAR